jgi:ornithine cyclodeaminase/alanine dehydrogenase-like protein (mu-crystallin family)
VSPPFVDERALRAGLSMSEAVDALESAFGAARLPAAPQRQHLDVGNGDLLLMPSWSDGAVGVKLVTVAPGNPDRGLPFIHGIYVLMDRESLAPVALIDGAALTGMRTAAVSGLATRYLARPDASRLVIFGAGTQARWHVEAMRAERPIEHITVVATTEESARSFASRITDVQVEAGAPEAVAVADIVCTCTTSKEPVFDGSLLQPGTHVNSVGAYKPDARELDAQAVSRARLVVEMREAALEEAGDVVLAIEEGAISAGDIVADLRQVVRGEATARRNDEDITVFKSVGLAFEDLAVASAFRI